MVFDYFFFYGIYSYFYKTALHIAVANNNEKIVNCLLKNQLIDVNSVAVILIYFIKFSIFFMEFLNSKEKKTII